jgi:hypothetical protein
VVSPDYFDAYFATTAVPGMLERSNSSRLGNDHNATSGTGSRRITGLTSTINSVF